VYHAKLIKRIVANSPHRFGAEVQAGLDALAKTSEFTQVLEEEIAARHLAPGDVILCIPSIYKQACRKAPFNDSIITIYKEHHSMEQRAVFAAFLKMQSRWPDGLKWAEASKGGEGKRGTGTKG